MIKIKIKYNYFFDTIDELLFFSWWNYDITNYFKIKIKIKLLSLISLVFYKFILIIIIIFNFIIITFLLFNNFIIFYLLFYYFYL